MSLPLLQTKLYVPPPRPQMVQRSRLSAHLDGEGLRRLTLVSAPAGFGKTTVVSAWLVHTKQPTAWLSLAEDDNDPTRFLIYLIAALQICYPPVGETALALLNAPQAPPPKATLTLLLNDLGTLPSSVFLVLDDYHFITTLAIHEAVTFFIEHLPPQVHLVITTRVEPPLPLARWRTRNQLTEVHADELRFTLAEATAFLNEVMGLELAVAEIALLARRTEGWIAGLQLAALSLQRQRDRSGFIQRFSGDNVSIMDYLVAEVLQQQPAEVQDFLLRTAILDRLSASLCASLWRGEGAESRGGSRAQSGQPPISVLQAQARLERIHRDNLFLFALDEQRQWYRYHHLFADLLRQRLTQITPGAVAELHRQAAAWYADNGLIADAIHHALVGQDWAEAARLIGLIARETLLRNEMMTLLTWTSALPADLLSTQPHLCVTQAWALIATDRYAEAEARLQTAEALAANQPNLINEIIAVRVSMAAMRNDPASIIDLARSALATTPQEDRFLRSILGLNLGIAHRLRGEVTAARQALAEADTLERSAGNPFVTVIACRNLGSLHVMAGQLRQAEQALHRGLQAATTASGIVTPMGSMVLVGLGNVAYQRNELEQARAIYQRARELSRDSWVFSGWIEAHLGLAWVQWAAMDAAAVHTALQSATEVARQQNLPILLDLVAANEAHLLIAQGRSHAAAGWAADQQARFTAEGRPTHTSRLAYSTLTRWLLAQGHSTEALRLLDQLHALAESAGLTGRLIELLALQALALQAQKKTEQAQLALSRALTLAEPEGYIRLFVDEGDVMRLLILDFRLLLAHQPAHAQHTRLSVYLDQILSAFAPTQSPPSTTELQTPPIIHNPQPTIHNLIEPLSRRELEVLRLLAAGCSTQAIAEKLVITTGTVKNHLKSIFGKLAVHSRLQAVERARGLNLL